MKSVRTSLAYVAVALVAVVLGTLLFTWLPRDSEPEAPASTPESELAVKMQGREDLNISVLGDSTGNDSTEWVAQWGMLLATEGSSVQIRTWDHAQADWSDETLNYGSGQRSITIWNGSVSGATPSYPLGFKGLLQPVKPDIVIINYGHDHTGSPVSMGTEVTNLLDSLTVRWNDDISTVLTVQNPGQGTAATKSAEHQHVVRRIARDRELPVADVNNAFHSVGDLGSLMVNTVHPGPMGSMIWASTVNDLFKRK